MAVGAGCTIRLGPLMRYSAARMLELVIGALSPLTKDEDNGVIVTVLSCTDLVSELKKLVAFTGISGSARCMRVASGPSRNYTLQDCITLLDNYYRGAASLNNIRPVLGDILLEFKEHARSWGGTGGYARDLVRRDWNGKYGIDVIVWLFLAKTLTRLTGAQGSIHLAARLPPATSVASVDARGLLLSSWAAARLHYNSRLDLSSWPLYLLHALYASLYTSANPEADPRLATQLYIIVLVGSTLASIDREPVPEAAFKLRKALERALTVEESRGSGGVDKRRFNSEVARVIASLFAIYRGAARQREGAVREALRRLLEEYSHALITGLLLEDPERLAAALRIARRTSDVLYWQHASPALISAVSRLAKLASMLVVYAGG